MLNSASDTAARRADSSGTRGVYAMCMVSICVAKGGGTAKFNQYNCNTLVKNFCTATVKAA